MEQKEIARLFREEEPLKITVKNSSRGESDFREALFVEYGDEKIVIKLADNGFTDEEHLTMWMTIAEKYKELPKANYSADLPLDKFPKGIYTIIR